MRLAGTTMRTYIFWHWWIGRAGMPLRRSQLADLLEQQGDTDQVAALSFAAADQTQDPRLLRRLL